MKKEPDILKIVKEDILEALRKKNGQALLSHIKPEIKVSPLFISKAVKKLEKEELVRIEEDSIYLSAKGAKKAEAIAKKHLILENYFAEIKDGKEAYKKASILEHYVSMEVIDNIKKLSTLRDESISLSELELGSKGMVTDITFSDYGLLERIVSMGVCLGVKIKAAYSIPNGLVVNTGGKNFAMGKEIAREIKVFI
jgi:Mn-dependent DtxR family transcriptional regulator/Fe2+ transport system protein FeoA